MVSFLCIPESFESLKKYEKSDQAPLRSQIAQDTSLKTHKSETEIFKKCIVGRS